MARQMMDPELAELFAAEFTVEWNRLAAKPGKELKGVERQLSNLVEAIATATHLEAKENAGGQSPLVSAHLLC